MRVDARLVMMLPAACVVVGCAMAPAPSDLTVTFLVSDLTIPPVDDAGRFVGIDIDGLDSAGADTSTCDGRTRDFVSLYDPSEHGIDNVVGRLVNVDLTPLGSDPSATDLIARGHLAIALRVSGIDSFTGDDAVRVQLGTAHVPGCDTAVPETCAPVFDGATLSSGQPVVFQSVGPPVSMRIVAGRLQGELGAVAVPAALLHAPGEAAVLALTIRTARIDVVIQEDGLSGSLAGGLSVNDMLELALMLDPTTDPELGRRALEFEADLDRSPSDPLLCAALSVGIQLSAVPVTPTD